MAAEPREPTVERVRTVSSIQDDYAEFRDRTPVKRVFDPVSELHWTYYESVTQRAKADRHTPSVVLLPGICGTAASYFYLFNRLSDLFPEYLSPFEWIAGFLHFVEFLGLDRPCVFASDLGGFLLQLFVERYPDALHSIVLCNSYRRTDEFSASPGFRDVYGGIYSVLPHAILKTVYLESYVCPAGGPERVPLREQFAREFVANELDQLTAGELGSRVTLQLTGEFVTSSDLSGFGHGRVLLVESTDSSVPPALKRDIRAWWALLTLRYKNAKVGHVRAGDFPFLTQPDEVALFIQVHINNVRYAQSDRAVAERPGDEINYDSESSVINA